MPELPNLRLFIVPFFGSQLCASHVMINACQKGRAPLTRFAIQLLDSYPTETRFAVRSPCPLSFWAHGQEIRTPTPRLPKEPPRKTHCGNRDIGRKKNLQDVAR